MKPATLLSIAVSAASVAVLALPCVAAQDSVLAEDDFSTDQLASDWTWVRQDEAGWRLADGKLAIRTRGQLWGRENSQRNVLLLANPSPLPNAVAAELTVDAGLAMTHAYEHGGLIWYFDDDHWVTLTQLNHVQHETQKIMLVHESDGRGRDRASKAVPFQGEKVELRLERRGAEFTGYFRPPGAEAWQRLGTVELEHSGSTPTFGVVAGQGKHDEWHWVEFDDFRVLALP
ncbi:MAG: hypothetical protein AAF604_10675 [Acidobacteriota bacterium]